VSDGEPEVRAAGGVVWRSTDRGGVEVLVVHRPKYDDWSFPKGKLDAGETHEAAALREVEEETGLRCELAHELPSCAYRDHKDRSKVVRYWAMDVVSGALTENDEVDELRWMAPGAARALLTYDHDRTVLDAFVG
jgi:8-oxo-dGTP pyrophosphatase MutT (NUDIX family)